MKITKLGHSCVLIEEGGVRILIDPGQYSIAQNDVKDIDVILITHEHPDHMDFDSIKKVLAHNPQATIYTNKGVSEKLREQNIDSQLLLHGQRIDVRGVSVEGHGEKHALIYPTWPTVDNTGYLIAKRLYHPGDALFVPSVPVEVLALPVSAPWMTLAQALDYAQAVKPQHSFPIHDGMLKFIGPVHRLPLAILPPAGVPFSPLEAGGMLEF